MQIGIGVGIGIAQGQGSGEAAPATPWYLAGSVAAENVIFAYQAKGAANPTASCKNLANPGTNDAAAFGTPRWDVARGWQGDTSWASGIIGPVIQPTSTILCRFSDVLPWGTNEYYDTEVLCGVGEGDAPMSIWPQQEGDFWTVNCTGSGLSLAPGVASGVLGLGNWLAWKDGVQVNSRAPEAYAPNVTPLGILGFWTPSQQLFYSSLVSGWIQAIAGFTSITAAQVAAVSAAMAAL